MEKLKLIFNGTLGGGIESTGKQQVRRGWEILHVTCFAMWISIGR